MQNYIYFVFKLKPSFVERYEFTKTPENAPKVQILYCHPIEGWFLRVTSNNNNKEQELEISTGFVNRK